MLKDRLDAVVGHREELLELAVGECSPLRAALVVDQVRERVPLVADLLWRGSEALVTVDRPSVPRIGEVVAEQANDGVIAANRRGRRRLLSRLRPRREVLQVPR